MFWFIKSLKKLLVENLWGRRSRYGSPEFQMKTSKMILPENPEKPRMSSLNQKYSHSMSDWI